MTDFEPIGSGFFGVIGSQCIVFGLFQSPILSNVPFWGVFGGFRRAFFACSQWVYFGLYIALNAVLQACLGNRAYYILIG